MKIPHRSRTPGFPLRSSADACIVGVATSEAAAVQDGVSASASCITVLRGTEAPSRWQGTLPLRWWAIGCVVEISAPFDGEGPQRCWHSSCRSAASLCKSGVDSSTVLSAAPTSRVLPVVGLLLLNIPRRMGDHLVRRSRMHYDPDGGSGISKSCRA